MAQRLNKNLVVVLTLLGAVAMLAAGVLLIMFLPAQDPTPLMQQADDLSAKERYAEAQALYVRAASAARRTKPDNPYFGKANDCLLRAGDMAYALGRMGDAEGTWETVLRDDPANEAAQLRILNMYMDHFRLWGDTGYWPKIEEEARQLVNMKAEKPNPAGVRALGLALLKQRDVKPANAAEGEQLLKSVLETNPTDADAVEYLADYYVQDARELLQDARPQDTHARADTRLADARQLFDKLITALPAEPKAAAAVWRARGMFYLNQRDMAKARLRMLLAGTLVAGSEADLRSQLATADQLALDALKKSVDLDDTEAKNLSALGTYWASKDSEQTDPAKRESELAGFRDKAIERYKAAIKAAPKDFDCPMRLAMLYRLMNEPAQAADVLEARISTGSLRGKWEGRWSEAVLGTLREQAFAYRIGQAEASPRGSEQRDKLTENLKKLCADYAAGAQGGEENSTVKFMRGQLLALDGKLPEARKLVEDANTAMGGNNAEVKLRLARLYEMTDAPGRAEELYRELTQSGTIQAGTAWILLANVELKLGKYEQAQQAAERARAMFPKAKEPVQVLWQIAQAQNNRAAEEEYARILGIKKSAQGTLVLEAQTLAQKAFSEQPPDAAGVKAAKAKLQEALDADPSYFPALKLLALILARREGDSEEVGAQKAAELKAALDAGLAAVEQKAKAATASAPADARTSEYNQLAAGIRQLAVYSLDETKSADDRLNAMVAVYSQEPDAYLRAVALAGLYESAGKFAEAVAQLKLAQDVRPKGIEESTVLEQTLRLAMLSKDTWSDAEACIAKLAALGASQTRVRTLKAQLIMIKTEAAGQDQDTKQAQAYAEQARKLLAENLKEFPEDTDTCVLMAQAQAVLGDFDAALQNLNTALRLNPRHQTATLLMYQLVARQQDEAQRLVWLSKLRAVWPNHPIVVREDQAAADERDPKSAITRREKLAQEQPKDLNNLLVLAALYTRTGALDDARRTYEQCRQLQPDNLVVVGRYAAFLREKTPPEPAAAEQLLKQVLVATQDPAQKAKVQLMLAGHYQQMYQQGGTGAPSLADVATAYEAATKIREAPDVLTDVANFYLQTGQTAEAEARLRRALDLTQTDEQRELARRIHRVLIQLLFRSPGDRRAEIEKEIVAYAKRFDDGFADLAHSDLAVISGEMPQAIEHLTAYINKFPNNPQGYLSRAKLHFQRGAIDDAIQDLDKTQSADPRSLQFENRALMARCLEAKGQTDLAIAQLSTVVEQNPDAGAIVKQLVDLYVNLKQWAPAESLVLPRSKDLSSPSRLGWLRVLAEIYTRKGEQLRAIQTTQEAVEVSGYKPLLLDALGTACLTGHRPQDFISFVTQKAPAEAQQDTTVRLRLAEAYAAAKQNANAKEIYTQLVGSANGNFGQMAALFSSALGAAGKEGEGWFKQQLATTPGDRAIQFALAATEAQAGGAGYTEAMATLDKLLAETTGNDARAQAEKAQLLRALSIAAHTHRDLVAARKYYEQLLAVDPQNFLAANNLAYLLMTEFKDLAKARALASDALRNLSANASQQEKATLLDTLGWAQVQTNELDAGVASLQQATGLAREGPPELNYTLASMYYHLAEAYARRSTAEANRRAEFDRNEAAVAGRRAWRLLQGTDPADPEGMRAALTALADRLKIQLEISTPTSGPAPTS